MEINGKMRKNEKSCVWHATDYSDGELKEQLFCVRFASTEIPEYYLRLRIKVWGTGTFFGVGVSYLQTKLDAGGHDHTSTISCLQDTGITRHLPYILLCEELKGVVASTFVAFTTPPSNAEYNCVFNEIMDPSGMSYDVYGVLWRCFTRSIRWPKTSVILYERPN
ncbi:hypothetical protein C5167_008251 [Papaver somniferum]|uniref:Uncharacterized protein n=1 Tax=Papaver somniferum TaxID=3469 RepID=A0A4Y7JV26_PAPSO|nr:hypothetical protein C5167_008251 [Papaver somniferum]